MIRGIMYQQMFTLCFLTASLHWTAELNTQSESVIKSFLFTFPMKVYLVSVI